MKCEKMRKYIGIALMTCLLTPSLGVARETDDLRRQLQELIEQNKQLTQRISEIEKKLVAREAETIPSGEGQSFLQTITDSVEISGLVEVELNSTNDDINDEDTSDITLATVEIGIDASLSEWASAHLLFLYEEGEESDHITVDEGTITVGNIRKFPVYLTAGKMYVPFGSFESNMISDPLTLEIGETRDTAVQVGFESGSFYGSVYAYNGDVNETDEDDKIDTFGVNAGYGMENEQMALDVGWGWTNNIGDSDALGDHIDATSFGSVDDYVAGLSFHAVFTTGPFMVIGEYVTALDDFEATELAFKGDGAEPEAWNIEIGYTTEFFNRETTFAIGYQGTDEALALGLPEERYLVAASLGIFDNTALSLEWAHDEDYDDSDGGTGKDSDSATMQLAVEF
jgi:hypothetical protein